LSSGHCWWRPIAPFTCWSVCVDTPTPPAASRYQGYSLARRLQLMPALTTFRYRAGKLQSCPYRVRSTAAWLGSCRACTSKGSERHRANQNAPHHVSVGRRGRRDRDRHRAECFDGTESAALLRRGGIDELSKTGQRAGLHLASALASGFPPEHQPAVACFGIQRAVPGVRV
jgi:hypothetical protein